MTKYHAWPRYGYRQVRKKVLAYSGITWIAIWAGIFSAIAVIVSGGYLFHPSAAVLGATGWLSVIATALAWIAAGAIYNAGRRSTATTYNRSTTVAPNQPPARISEQ